MLSKTRQLVRWMIAHPAVNGGCLENKENGENEEKEENEEKRKTRKRGKRGKEENEENPSLWFSNIITINPGGEGGALAQYSFCI